MVTKLCNSTAEQFAKKTALADSFAKCCTYCTWNFRDCVLTRTAKPSFVEEVQHVDIYAVYEADDT